jgi:hypothetical protein
MDAHIDQDEYDVDDGDWVVCRNGSKDTERADHGRWFHGRPRERWTRCRPVHLTAQRLDKSTEAT